MTDDLQEMAGLVLSSALLMAWLALIVACVRRVVRAHVGEDGVDLPATLFLFLSSVAALFCMIVS